MYFFNRVQTFVENVMTRTKLSVFHTGYHTFARKGLEKRPPLENNDDDDFVFDNELLFNPYDYGFRIGEITYAKNFPEGSSISVTRSAKYGLGRRKDSLLSVLNHMRAYHPPIFIGAPKKAPSTPVCSAL